MFQLGSDFQTNSLDVLISAVQTNPTKKVFSYGYRRYDGSSRFAEGQKWGLFPSVALGWNMVEENFFQNLKSIICGTSPRFGQDMEKWAIRIYQTLLTGACTMRVAPTIP